MKLELDFSTYFGKVILKEEAELAKPKRKRQARASEILKRQERRQKNLESCNLHHLNPTSRIPRLIAELRAYPEALQKTGLSEEELLDKIWATKIVDCRIHEAWHTLFSNMFSWEAVKQIRLWANAELTDFVIGLRDDQRAAWNMLFGSYRSPREAIEVIKMEWWPEYPPLKEKLGGEK